MWKIISDATSFSLQINSMSNKNHEAKVLITISKNPQQFMVQWGLNIRNNGKPISKSINIIT